MKQKAQVKLSFEASQPHSWLQLWELIDMWARYEDIGLAPERYASGERTLPLATWDKARMEQTWLRASGGIFKRKHPWNMSALVFFAWNRYKQSPIKAFSSFTLWLDPKFFVGERRTERFLELCKDLYRWGQMDHGYVVHDDEYSLKNIPGAGPIGSSNLKVALPGIYWANFFGPRYVRWFGEEKFESLETFRKERLPDGGWLL